MNSILSSPTVEQHARRALIDAGLVVDDGQIVRADRLSPRLLSLHPWKTAERFAGHVVYALDESAYGFYVVDEHGNIYLSEKR